MVTTLFRLAAGARGRTLPLVVALYGLAYVGWLTFTTAPDDVRSLVANLGYVPVGFAAAFIAHRVAVHPAAPVRLRRGWALLTLACLLTFAADLWWTVDENLLGRDPSASWVNVVYLLYYVSLVAGLVLIPEPIRSPQEALKYLLDAAIVVAGGGMLVWHFVIAPTIAGGHADLFPLVVAVSYPAADLLALFGVAVVLLRLPGGARQRPLLLIAASVAAMMVGDLVWARLSLTGDYAAGQLQDALYMAQYVLFAAAAAEEWRCLSQLGGGADGRELRPVTVLPYVAVACGYGLLLFVGWHGATRELFQLRLGALVLTALLVGRQVVSVIENVRLSRERLLHATEARFRSLIQHASDIVSIVDEAGRFTYVSPSAAQILGHSSEGLVGTLALDIVHPEDRAVAAERLDGCRAAAGRPVTGRWRLRRGDGTWIQTDTICTNLTHDENVRGIVLNTRDVSSQCALEAQLTHQAFHDPLTGLANRALFENRLTHALAQRQDATRTSGVLFVDLDHFKTVNDSLGHAAGDALLQQAAARLSGCLRDADTVARMGGDEFAVLVPSGRPEEMVMLGERIAAACHAPFWVEGRELQLSASVGVAMAASGQSAQELLRNADLAMYLAKNRGRGQSAVYRPEMHSAAMTRLELLADLRHALDREQLFVVYQPIHALETGALVGMEALLRWRHPVHGAVSPLTFIPLAEEGGHIVPIGRWALEQACRDARMLQRRLASDVPLRVTVNLSARQLGEASFVPDVQSALTDAGLAPESLVLELTESTLTAQAGDVRGVLQRLKSSGVGLAIDDFGSGGSSLSYLQRLPIDILKIDRMFVERVGRDRSATAVTDMIIALGQTLAISTVAEGVETRQQALALYHSGCELGQGFFFSPPIAPGDVEEHAQRAASLRAA